MGQALSPTPYAEVNDVLRHFEARIRAILGRQLIGMYLYGSLALGDFDPQASDIDFLVVTDGEIADEAFRALQALHAEFDAGGSPWAARIEAAYIPQDVVRRPAPAPGRFPQLERGLTLTLMPLEIGWAFQCHTLREYGVVVAGPAPRTLINPADPQDFARATLAIAGGWLDQARRDPEWLDWVRQRDAHSFVVLTLCRLLYSLATGAVASKPAAARWAQAALGPRWAGLIERALAGQHAEQLTPDGDVDEMLALIRYTVEHCSARERRDGEPG